MQITEKYRHNKYKHKKHKGYSENSKRYQKKPTMRCVKKSEMKNQIRQKTISKLTTVIVSILLILGAFSGCGSSNTDSSGDTTGTEEQTSENASEEEENRTGLLLETAKDGRIDFTVLQEENPEIWGWLYIPGTDIDRPLLQSATSDTYYQNHMADGQEGSLYRDSQSDKPL